MENVYVYSTLGSECMVGDIISGQGSKWMLTVNQERFKE